MTTSKTEIPETDAIGNDGYFEDLITTYELITECAVVYDLIRLYHMDVEQCEDIDDVADPLDPHTRGFIDDRLAAVFSALKGSVY